MNKENQNHQVAGLCLPVDSDYFDLYFKQLAAPQKFSHLAQGKC